MDGQGNGLTLEGLAQRLEALQRENAQNAQRLETLERENAELRRGVSAPRGSGTPPNANEVVALRGSDTSRDGEAVSEFEGRVSRRTLLSKAGAAAVAAVAAGTLLNPREAKANHLGPGIDVDYVNAHSDNRTGVKGISTAANGVYGYSYEPTAAGVGGGNNFGTGVKGYGETGVHGTSSRTGYSGVYGQHTGEVGGFGVVGDGAGDGTAGVLGRGKGGAVGVRGEAHGIGPTPAVHGVNTGVGDGVLGETSALARAGIYGRSPNGWGGRFEGGNAHLLLIPRDSVGFPTTGGAHAKGELSMDKNATLWVCVEGGNPGTWRRVATTAG